MAALGCFSFFHANFKWEGIQVISGRVSGGWEGLSLGQWGKSSQFGSWATEVREEGGRVSSAGPCFGDRPALRSGDFREFINGSQRPGHCSHPPDSS